jgi:hypothetical protein
LDQILLTFGSLAIYYRDIKTTDSANILGATAILESIEKRWAKADQDVFIAAVLLNPFVKASPFSPQVPFLTRAGVLSLMKRLYLRFFSVTETTNELSEHTQQLFSNLEDYLGGRGICAEMTQYIDAISEETRRTGISPDPVMVYHGISPIVAGSLPPLFKLACHVLSICPNSASCERLFSVFGNTLTKLRNRLGNQTLSSLAELKMHIRDGHMCNGRVKERMKRFFGKEKESQTNTPLADPVSQQPSTPPPPPTDEMGMDIATEIDPDLPSQGGIADEFNQITESFGRQASGDDNDGSEGMPSVISIEIAQLFDFTNRAWIPSHERSASRSLDEELELYELLDLDAPGEEDIDVEIDHALDSILHHI